MSRKYATDKIKVCFISLDAYRLFDPEYTQIFGGAEVQLFNIGNALSKDNKFETYFIVKADEEGIKKYNNIKIHKIKKKYFPNNKIDYSIKYFKLSRILKKIDADVYIQSAAGFLTTIVAVFCRKNNKRFIYRLASDSECDFKRFKLLTVFQRIIYKSGLKKANLILCQNEKQKRLLKKNFLLDSIMIKSMFKIHRIKKKIGKYILWVARCESLKQPEIFIKLAEEFPHEKFVMICPRMANKTNYFKKIKNRALKTKNITFIDSVHFNKIEDYFKNAKVFINTSIFEGFPNTFIQAWKNKTPVISLNVNPDNSIDTRELGFYSKTHNQIKKDLKTLLSNKKLYARISENCFNYVKKKHDINNIIKKFKHLLREPIIKTAKR